MLHFSKNTGTILMNVAVGVITRKRPRGIARLLESISALHRAQDGGGTVRVTLIVVENDISSALSEPLSCKVPIHYVLEPRVGIPCARNRVIKEALLLDPRPEWLAFVDDDETVEPNWLQIMAAAAVDTDADVLTGPSLPMLPEPVPKWATTSGAYEQPRYPTGTSLPHAYTNNVWMRLSCVTNGSIQFDERLLHTGGSDTHFFRKLARNGHRIMWCDEALCREWYPSTRMTRRWILQRAYRIGATNAWIMRDIGECGRLGCLWQGVRFIARGLVRTARALFDGNFSAATMTLPLDGARATGLVLGAFGRAKHQEYQVLHGD